MPQDLQMRNIPRETATATLFAIMVGGALTFGVLGADSPKDAPLELLIEAQSVPQGTPQSFTFSILNKTDHDLHLPSPTVGCSDSFDGSISLHIKFHPANPADEMDEGGGCAGDLYGGWPSILVRVKSWQVLPAGKRLTILANRDRFQYTDRQPGRYEFWAMYQPPFVSKVDQQLLVGSGVDFPRVAFTSKHLVFEKPR